MVARQHRRLYGAHRSLQSTRGKFFYRDAAVLEIETCVDKRQKRERRGYFVNFRSKAHKIETVNFHRTCLSAYNDKRFVLDDGITTLAYGHYSMRAPDVIVID